LFDTKLINLSLATLKLGHCNYNGIQNINYLYYSIEILYKILNTFTGDCIALMM